jgi:hypothetical protein
MKYAVEMGSDAMIYIPSFIRNGSGIDTTRYTHRQQGDLISLLLFFFQNKGSRPKVEEMLGDRSGENTVGRKGRGNYVYFLQCPCSFPCSSQLFPH